MTALSGITIGLLAADGTHEPTLALVRAVHERGETLGAICHGQWVLVSADVLRGRRATSPRDIAVDLTNAGAEWVERDAVRDGHIVTAVYFACLPAFMRLLIESMRTRRQEPPRQALKRPEEEEEPK